jgi:hypothetical protein
MLVFKQQPKWSLETTFSVRITFQEITVPVGDIIIHPSANPSS